MRRLIFKIIWAPVFWFILAILIFFFPVFFQNQVFYYGDILTSYLPYINFLHNSLKNGIFPLWNPYILSGYPVFADISLGTYYPPNWLVVLKPTMKVFSLVIIFHFFIALVSMYFLVRRLSLSRKAAVFSSLTFSFSGLFVNYIADTARLFVVALYPLFLFSLLTLFKKKNYLWFLITVLVLTLQIFAGHIQYVLIELIFLPWLIFLNYLKKVFLGRFLLSMAVVCLAVLFSAVIILPVLEIIPFSTRSDIHVDLAIQENFSLKPVSVIKFLIAHFWGVRNQGSAWGTMETNLIGYIGFMPLFLVALTIKRLLRNTNAFLLMTMALFSLVISFGVYLPFFHFLVKLIPFFRIFRNPMSFLAVYTFSMSLVAGYALDFINLRGKTRKVLRNLFLLLGLIFLLIYIVVSCNNRLPYQFLIFSANLIGKQLSLFHTLEVDFLIAKFITLNILLVCFFGFIAFFFKRKEVFVLLVFLDLFILTRSEFLTIDNNYLKMADLPMVEYLMKNLKTERFLSISGVVPYSGLGNYFGNLFFQPPFAKEGKKLERRVLDEWFLHEINLIPPNFSAYYGISTVNGWATFILKNYNDFFQKEGGLNKLYQQAAVYNPLISQTKPDIFLTGVDFSKVNLDDEIFNLLSVKYLISDRLLDLSYYQPVFNFLGIFVYENKKVGSRAVIVDEENDIVGYPLFLQEAPNLLVLWADKKGKLILWDTFYKGWNVYINGQKSKIESYNKAFRAVDLNSENAQVEFKFEPLSFKYGSLISFFSFFIAVIFLYFKNFLNR